MAKPKFPVLAKLGLKRSKEFFDSYHRFKKYTREQRLAMQLYDQGVTDREWMEAYRFDNNNPLMVNIVGALRTLWINNRPLTDEEKIAAYSL